MEDQENYWFYSLCLLDIKVLNVLFTTILAKIYLVLTVKNLEFAKMDQRTTKNKLAWSLSTNFGMVLRQMTAIFQILTALQLYRGCM